MKQIKISDAAYEELSNRKYREESFDDVLKREMGLLPETVDEITISLPDRLRIATKLIVENLSDSNRYKQVGEQEENKQVLHFLSKETEKLIFEVVVYQPIPRERVNHRVDIRYQNSKGEMERIFQIRDTEANAVDIEYKNAENHKVLDNNREGADAGEKTAELFRERVSEFVDQAYEQWGNRS